MSHRSALIWLALGLAAAVQDAQSLQAALWLSRCTSGDTATVIAAALRVDEHALAFPWTMVVMVLRCLNPPTRCHADARARARSLLVMLLLMPLVCLASALLVQWMPPASRTFGYAVLMLLLSALPGQWRQVQRRGIVLLTPAASDR